MIARRQNIRAQVEKLFGNLGRHSKPARGILRVDDQQFDIVCLAHMVNVLAHNPPPRASENVANKKDVQKDGS